MSFMFVKGKVYICEKCGYRLYVDYIGGSLYVHISDIEIMRQLEIAKELNEQQSQEDGFYLYDIGICQNCYDKLDEIVKTNSIKFIELISKVEEKHNQTYSILEKEIENFVKEAPNILKWEDISKAIERDVNIEELIDRRPIKSKKRSPIRRFIHQNAHQLSNYIIDYFLNTPNTIEILDNYKNSLAPILDEIKKIIKETPTIYISKLTNVPENLNPVMVTDMSVRVPVENTKEELFYYPIEVNFDRIVEEYEFNTYKLSLPKGSLYSIVTEIFEREIANKGESNGLSS
jgi:hypothetical protein